MLTSLLERSAAVVETGSLSIMRITVCICTFRRPAGLAAVLRGIERLKFQSLERPALSVVVVDNEGSADARAAAEAFAAGGIPTTYVVETRRGISQARNACLDCVPADADFVAFLDDDVVPRARWLEELVLAIEATGAQAATGPYVPVYAAGTPEWIRAGRFFASPRAKKPTDRGAVEFGIMGNIIFRGTFLRTNDFRFDERFSLVGGEDRKFYMDMFDKGGEFVWADRAVVDHHVSSERLTFGYIVRREFCVGCAAAMIKQVETRGDRRFVLYALQVVGRLLLKLALWVPASLSAFVRNNAYFKVKPTLDVANLGGRLYGLFGHKYELYK